MKTITSRVLCCAVVSVLFGAGCPQKPAQPSLEQRLLAKDQAARARALAEASTLAPEARKALAMSLVASLRSADADTRNNAADAEAKLNLGGPELRTAVIQALNRVGTEDTQLTAFLYGLEGRWNLSSYRKGNESWWPDHGSSRPKNETHWIFRPRELVIESHPEFNPPFVSERWVWGSVRRVTSDVFDVRLQKSDDSSIDETKRFKLSPNGKILEIATNAQNTPEPVIQVMDFISTDGPDEKP